MSLGWNPIRGFDDSLPPGFPQPGAFDPPNPHLTHGWNFVRGGGAGQVPPGFQLEQAPTLPAVTWAYLPQTIAMNPPVAAPIPAFGSTLQYAWPGACSYGVQPAANAEASCTDLPGMNLNNPHGGTGSLPGYAYLFHPEHTLVHVLKCKEPPWQLAPNAPYDFHKAQVPCNTSIKDFLAGFGAKNADPKKNVVHEVVKDSRGRWRQGIRANGSEKKNVGDIGWTMKRTGRNATGEGDVVWAWISKD